MASNQCARCSASLPIPYAQLTTLRCYRCGAVHHADGEVISPRMLPAYYAIDARCNSDQSPRMIPGEATPKASPWMQPDERPVEHGHYDVRFRDDTRLVLWWNGERFCTWDMQPVSDRTLLSWRGAWE